MCNFTWILSVFTPYTCITTVGTVVRIGVAASALEKSLLTSKTTQTMQKDWATSSTKCTAADVGICNWVGMERRYFYWHIGLAKLSLCMASIGFIGVGEGLWLTLKIISLTWVLVSELFAHHCGLSGVPSTVTHSSPHPIDTHLHSPFIAAACSTHQTNTASAKTLRWYCKCNKSVQWHC